MRTRPSGAHLQNGTPDDKTRQLGQLMSIAVGAARRVLLIAAASATAVCGSGFAIASAHANLVVPAAPFSGTPPHFPFPTPINGTILHFPTPEGGEPHGIGTGPEGDIWFTEFRTSKIGEINPVTHAIREFPTPTTNSNPTNITAGPEGNMWFSESSQAGHARIGRINPFTHTITEFPLPEASAGSYPYSIVAGSDGELWFAELTKGSLGRINPKTGVITEFPLPGGPEDSFPIGLTAGPEGNIWFADAGTSKIGRLDPNGSEAQIESSLTEFSVPVVTTENGSGLTDIAKGPDGNMWFTEYGANKIGRLDPQGTPAQIQESVTIFPVPNNDAGSYNGPWWIAGGAGGNIWFTEQNYENYTEDAIGRITPAGVVTLFNQGIPSPDVPGELTLSHEGDFFFTEAPGEEINKDEVSPGDGIAEFFDTPAVAFSPTELDFGFQRVGTAGWARTVIVTDTSTAPMITTAVGVTGADPADYRVSADHCTGVAVEPFRTCTVQVLFAPTAAGPRSAALTFTDNSSTHTVSLTGTGAAGRRR